MSAQHPTPDDLRTIAANLAAEGQTSRAEVLNNAADKWGDTHNELRDADALLDVAIGYLRDLVENPNSYTAQHDAREWLDLMEEA